jgi:curli biogenesis system outer membrane secretion channel CsgG
MSFNSRFTSLVATFAFSCGSIGLIDSLSTPRAHAGFGKPITVAVKKVKDNAGASWFRKSYEDKLATILSTELTNSGNFTVLAREDDALKAIQEELNMAGINKNTAVKKNNKTQARYIIVASLSDFNEQASESGGGGISIMGFGGGKSKKTIEYYVSFDLKVIDTSTTSVAYSRTIEGVAKAETTSSNAQASYMGVSVNQNKAKETKAPVSRAVRAAMVEISQYLDCVLYQKDECVDEYIAKDEARKESTKDSLDMF